MEPTSEQELKQLLDEGKITEEEYKELLEALRQKETAQKPVEKPTEPKPRTGYGKAALILMIAGIGQSLAVILFVLLMHRVGVRLGIMIFPSLLLGLLCELLAFIFGIIDWKTVQGKIAVIGIPVLGISAFLLGVLVLPVMGMVLPVLKGQAEHKYQESHKEYPLDSMEGVLMQDGIELDNVISWDGNGSLKTFTNSVDNKVVRKVIRLFETGPMGIENCMLIYSAHLKSELEDGSAYLEMWCEFDGKGEYFSRGLAQPISGFTNWTTVQTPFRLEHGQSPANVKLNLVIEGAGTVWIDDIKLSSNPLN